MNYPPSYHTETDDAKVFDAIDAIRQATLLVPSADAGLHVAFTPFLLDRARRTLRGHVARRNPQAALFDGRAVEIVFHGPHAYISPQLNDNDDVPTWNYVNVHVTGRAARIDDDALKWRFLCDLVQVMEKDNADGYLAAQEPVLRRLLDGIVAFEVRIEKMLGRFKLGRNDAPALQARTFAALQAETPASLQDWLRTLAPS